MACETCRRSLNWSFSDTHAPLNITQIGFNLSFAGRNSENAWRMERFERFWVFGSAGSSGERRFLSVFEHSSSEQDGFGSICGSWKTALAVPFRFLSTALLLNEVSARDAKFETKISPEFSPKFAPIFAPKFLVPAWEADKSSPQMSLAFFPISNFKFQIKMHPKISQRTSAGMVTLTLSALVWLLRRPEQKCKIG